MQDNEVSASNINGLFRFDSLTQFLTNQPSLFSGTGSPLPLDIGVRETLFGAYVQDDIKLPKTLTLNAGLRYEMLTVPTEAHGLTSVLRNLTDPLPVCGVANAGCAVPVRYSRILRCGILSRAWDLPGILERKNPLARRIRHF